ncbi:MAG: NAD-dependent epimerase/dehydratase family protein [Candidatus Nanoarchaeia archaeon]|nr:NAD-dependent epimerase/dehydratase family protein [Candidatus Nanoarchaeia archaeon]MDD5239262.1 NAD-dependent epimerase/dehydratase family protein [Candidatus Nanoarchaeia archaeon]
MKDKTILITGATGLIGSYIVEKLVKDNDVRCLVIKNSDVSFLENVGAKVVYGDITDKSTLGPALKDVDIVFHLAAAFKKDLPEKHTEAVYFKINVDGTRNMLEAAKENHVKRFVHFGAGGVYGFTASEPSNENSPYNPSNAYERSKCEGEKLALEFNQAGLPVTIIQPAVVYGPREKASILKFFKAVKMGIFPIIGNGKNKMDFVFVEDIADGAILAAEKENAVGQKYIIGGDRAYTFLEILQVIADTLKVPVPKIKVPYFLAKIGAGLLEIGCSLIGMNPPVKVATMDFLSKNKFYDTSKARKELGYEPKVDLKKGMEITMKWYKDNGLL